ncbi:hypothetical protein KIL84_002107 [Mauremys mutica]|uniref:Uncharacterized protein n=1 Tax=Mauremys mutica TaxID=74926 RepID=A0A9D3XJQ3_9SAUR|nr:hypothetical protein KIL84_002107 [Mauremys mutica]
MARGASWRPTRGRQASSPASKQPPASTNSSPRLISKGPSLISPTHKLQPLPPSSGPRTLEAPELRVAPTPLRQLNTPGESAARRVQPWPPPPVPQGSSRAGGPGYKTLQWPPREPQGGTQRGQQTVVDGDVSLPSC